MSFIGGGSDLPDFYREHGGAVISTAIDKYIFVMVNKKFDNGIRVAYSRTEEVSSVSEIEHRLVRAGLGLAGISGGVELATIADIPSRGTGLGSSSTFTVALMHALHAYCGRHASSSRLAQEACQIEIDICGEPIGKQDQYASAFGGFNLIEFHEDDSVVVSPVVCQSDTLRRLESSLLLLYTGVTRSASKQLQAQQEEVRSSAQKRTILKRMVDLCYDLRDSLQANNIDAFGELLHESWVLKKSLSDGISSSTIDEWYAIARRQGALGGKILGAGGGGFLLLTAPPERHQAICHALPQMKPMPIQFERNGSQIIFYNPNQSI